MRKPKWNKPKVCKFNDAIRVNDMPRAVDCNGGNCETCGWNPEVEAQRKKDIRAALHPVVKTWVIGRGSFETIEWKKPL